MAYGDDMTPQEKADALVEGGLADDVHEAAAMLLDMGEIDEDEAEEVS